MSPLAWGRGLKLFCESEQVRAYIVAPRVGAWIETLMSNLCDYIGGLSPLAWGRGLKHSGKREEREPRHVAPRVGAWIETRAWADFVKSLKSPLAWGRGLKPAQTDVTTVANTSPLAWGRGLKPR